MIKLISALILAGTALTNSTAETVLGAYNFPANFFQNGKVVRIRGCVRTTAQNSTDALTVRIRIGPTTLTGTAIFTSAAIDQVADDTCAFEVQFIVRDADSSGTLIASGWASPPDANGTALVSIAPAPLTTLDFTAIQRFEVTGAWSVANAGNSCQIEALEVMEIV